MSSVLGQHPCVNSIPFTRRVSILAEASLYVEGAHVFLHLVRGKGSATKAKWYEVEEIETQLGGRAFRLTPAIYCKLAGDETDYTVLLHGHESSCTCAGFTYTGGCSHVQALQTFNDEGRLPGRAKS
jgi:hypothetical protein